MDPRLAWGSVAALGLSLAAFGLVAPGAAGPLGVTLLGWAAVVAALVCFTTGLWGFRTCDPESETVAFADYAVLTLAVLVVLVATVSLSL
jgi:hypothetical protein